MAVLKPVLVVSIDALAHDDLQGFASLPNMGKVLSNSSVVDQVTAVCPTYTYPCHASIMTGCWPGHTSVIHNQSFPDGRWLWERSAIQVPTMTDVARAHGLTTACVCWPVMAGADVDYLIPEIWTPQAGDDPDSVFLGACSPKGAAVYKRHKHLLDWMRTPGMDRFACACICDILAHGLPDLSFVHFSYLDHQKHRNGADWQSNMDAMRFIDSLVGDILKAIESTGQDVQLVVLGDHAHRDFHTFFHPNAYLSEHGYFPGIRIHCASSCAYAYLGEIAADEAAVVLHRMLEEHPKAIASIMDAAAVSSQYHLGGQFSHLLVAQDGYNFSDGMEGPLYEDSGASRSSHGFLPDRGPFSPLVCAPAATHAHSCRAIDIAPTILSMLGISCTCDGVRVY